MKKMGFKSGDGENLAKSYENIFSPERACIPTACKAEHGVFFY